MIAFNKDIYEKEVSSGVIRKVLSYSNNLMCCELKFKKGSIGALHAHSHEQIGYVVSGSFEYEESGNKSIVEAGDSYYVAPNAVHGVVALEDSVLIDVFTHMRDDFL